MARLLSYQSGNWSGATTWKTITAAGYSLSGVGVTASTTSYVASVNFTPGAITVEGVGLYLSNRIASPSGTLDVQLWNATSNVQVALVTVNVADLPVGNGATNTNHLVYFEFSASQLLLAATNYQIRIRTSVAGTVSLWRGATAGNWDRFFLTPTIVSAAATDDLFICGKLTGAGAGMDYTVTMDNNNTNQYGFCAVGVRGTLQWVTASNTELRLGNDVFGGTAGRSLYVAGGVCNMGTSGTRIGSGNTAILRFNSTGLTTTTMNGIDVQPNSIFRCCGQRRTTNWNLLAANASAGATTLTLNNTHGWAIGDDIGIASTSRTASEFERRTLTGVTGTTVTFAGGLASAKSGTTPFQGEVINLTRNIIIQGVSTTQTGYIQQQRGAVLELDSVMLQFMGSVNRNLINSVGNSADSIGSCLITHCAFKDTATNTTCIFANNNTLRNLTISENVFYNVGNVGVSIAAVAVNQNVSGTSVTNNVSIGGVGVAFSILENQVPFTGNRVASCTSGSNSIVFGVTTSAFSTGIVSAAFSNNVAHSNANGIFVSLLNTNDSGNHADNIYVWRNVTRGVNFFSCFNSQFNNGTIIQNGTDNILLAGVAGAMPNDGLELNNCSIQGDTTFSTANGINLSVLTTTHIYNNVNFNNCNIGNTATHTTADFNCGSGGVTREIPASIVFNNCNLGSTTILANQAYLSANSYVGMQRLNGAVNSHRRYYRYGLLTADSTITRSAPLSMRLAPSNATYKQVFGNKVIAVASGTSSTIGVYVRCSVIGDGTAYNGARPRLILKKNPSLGVDADVVLATATGAADGAWQLISGTTASATTNGAWEVYVDCDGTTGWVNVDDWVIS